jgi:phosphonate transport system ATP-binding protein
MTSAAVFEVHQASRSFGAMKALDGVSLSIAPGEMTALIGPSGSGKTTLMRSLTGLTLIDPGAGRVTAFGQLVQADGKLHGDVRSIRARVGFIAQKFNLVGRLTLYSNVMIGALGRVGFWAGMLGRWPDADKRLGMQSLDRVGVAAQAGQRASSLSGGQQQRGAIARALVQKAEAILADEPVASLDPASARRVMDTLALINREDGAAVVVTLHQIDMALHYCSRIVAMTAGRIVYDGPPSGLTRERLQDIYGAEYEDALSILGAH